MSKRARQTHQRARQAAAALRERQRRQRNRMAIAGGAVGTVLLILGIFVVVKVVGGGASVAPPEVSSTESALVAQAVSQVSAELLDQVGQGTVTALPHRLAGQPPLTSDGKPLVVYLGAEYCPFCAAQRWGLVVALPRFGTFDNLR